MQNAQICILNLFKSGFISKQDLLKALKILEKFRKIPKYLILFYKKKFKV